MIFSSRSNNSGSQQQQPSLNRLGIVVSAVLLAIMIVSVTAGSANARRDNRLIAEQETPVVTLGDAPLPTAPVDAVDDLPDVDQPRPEVEGTEETKVDPGKPGTGLTSTPAPAPAGDNVEERETPAGPPDPEKIDIYVTPIQEPTYEGQATISVTKLGCPESFGGNPYELAMYCVEMDAPFKVYSTNSNDQFSGSFELNVFPGPTVIYEDVPKGWLDPIVYCDLFKQGGTSSGYFNLIPQGGSTATIDLDAGEYLHCQWYNLPVKGRAYLSINKHICPDGFYAYSEDWFGLALECGKLMDGVAFIGSFPNGLAFTEVTGIDNTIGIVDWMELTPGLYSIDEAVPVGYGEPLVYCIRRDVDTNLVQEKFQAIVYKGNRINLELYEDSNVACDWYNVPFTGDAAIVIDKHDCPDGTASDATQSNLAQTCVDDMNGVRFTINNGVDVRLEQDTGDVYNSGIFVDHLPGGTYVVTEKTPSGYGTPRIYCGTMADFESEPEPMEINHKGSVISVVVPDGGIVFCDWYNIPA